MRMRYAGRMKYCGIYRLIKRPQLKRLTPDGVYRMYVKSNLELLRLLFFNINIKNAQKNSENIYKNIK